MAVITTSLFDIFEVAPGSLRFHIIGSMLAAAEEMRLGSSWCQGEIGITSAMVAALLAQVKGKFLKVQMSEPL